MRGVVPQDGPAEEAAEGLRTIAPGEAMTSAILHLVQRVDAKSPEGSRRSHGRARPQVRRKGGGAREDAQEIPKTRLWRGAGEAQMLLAQIVKALAESIMFNAVLASVAT